MTYYDTIASSYDELHGDEQRKKARIAANYLLTRGLVSNHSTILDVGCGTGIATKDLPGKKQGIDPSEELVKQCPFPAIVGVAEHLPFADHSFDIVVCITALHNCADSEKALEEMKRVGKNVFAVSILKKANNYVSLLSLVRKVFKVQHEEDEDKDTILFVH